MQKYSLISDGDMFAMQEIRLNDLPELGGANPPDRGSYNSTLYITGNLIDKHREIIIQSFNDVYKKIKNFFFLISLNLVK